MSFKQQFSRQESASVERYVPLYRTLVKLAVISLLLIAPAVAYFIGEVRGNLSKSEQLDEQQMLHDASTKFDKELRSTKNQLNQAKTQVSVTKQTILSLRQDILQWREKYELLNKRVNRYRTVVESGSDSRDILVDQLSLYVESPNKDNSTTSSYFIESSIVQFTLSDDKFKGELKIQIKGIDKTGKNVTLQHADLFKEGFELLGFRYFQHNDFSFGLPDGFKPKILLLSISGSGISEPITQKYSWKSLVLQAGERQSCQPAT